MVSCHKSACMPHARLRHPAASLALLAAASTGAAAQPRVRAVDPHAASPRCVVELERYDGAGVTRTAGRL